MSVTSASGDSGVISSVERIEQQQEMYNLTVDEAHTYFVGEGQWLVHNACSSALDRAMGGEVGDDKAAHHLIPGQLEKGDKKHPLVDRAINHPTDPWKIDGANNGMHLPSTPELSAELNLPLHNTNHNPYTESVKRRLDQLEIEEDTFIRENGRPWTQDELKQKLDDVAEEYRQRLRELGGGNRVPKDGLPEGWP